METEIIQMLQGVRQGCSFSATLFILYINKLIAEIRKEGIGISIDATKSIITLLYADDVTIITKNTTDFINISKAFENLCAKHHLSTNAKKTEMGEQCKLSNSQITKMTRQQENSQNKR